MSYIESFSEFINENKETAPEEKHSVISDLLEIIIQFKVYHWQIQGTSSYGRHKAYDEFVEEFSELTDDFVESFQGRYGIIKITKKPGLQDIKDLSPDEYTETISDKIEKCKETFKEDYDLSTIIDDMIIQINKLKYLTTLE